MCEPEFTAESQGHLCTRGGHSNPPSCLWEPETATNITSARGHREGDLSFSKARGEKCRDWEVGGWPPRKQPHRLGSDGRVWKALLLRKVPGTR